MKGLLGVAGMGALWAVAWAAVGALIGMLDRSRSVEALWLGPPIGILPGFVSGVIFSVLLGIATVGRRLHELSTAAAVACGAAAGLVVGALPFFINRPPNGVPLWQVGFVVIGSMTALGAVLAVGSLSVVRRVAVARGAGA